MTPVSRRRVTSADVAARAGVSRTTVSFVLNARPGTRISPDTWRRVEEAARELGYLPHGAARTLAGGASHTIGMVLRQSAEQVAADALLAETLLGVAAEVRVSGYRVLVEPLPAEIGHYSELLISQQVDGLIVSGPRADDEELFALAADGLPVVLQGSLPNLAVPSVDVDNRAGARIAVEHLLGLGHRRIACITNAPLAYTAATERVAGYHDALDAAGIPPEDRLVAEGRFDAASGQQAMAGLLARSDPTAVFVASDVVAFGALGAAREAGRRIPDDLSVVGFDDIPLAAHFDPPLTTIRLPANALGAAAGRALVDLLAGRQVARRAVLATELIVRQTTAIYRPRTGGATARRRGTQHASAAT